MPDTRGEQKYTRAYTYVHLTRAKREGADGFTAPTNLVAALPCRLVGAPLYIRIAHTCRYTRAKTCKYTKVVYSLNIQILHLP